MRAPPARSARWSSWSRPPAWQDRAGSGPPARAPRAAVHRCRVRRPPCWTGRRASSRPGACSCWFIACRSLLRPADRPAICAQPKGASTACRAKAKQTTILLPCKIFRDSVRKNSNTRGSDDERHRNLCRPVRQAFRGRGLPGQPGDRASRCDRARHRRTDRPDRGRNRCRGRRRDGRGAGGGPRLERHRHAQPRRGDARDRRRHAPRQGALCRIPDARRGQAVQGVARRGVVVRDGDRLLRRDRPARGRPHRRGHGAGPVPFRHQGTAGHHRHHPAVQLSAGAAVLGGRRRAGRGQRGHRQAARTDQHHHAEVHGGLQGPAGGPDAVPDRRAARGAAAGRQPQDAWRGLYRVGRRRAGRGADLCRDVQALPDRGIGQRSVHRHALGAAGHRGARRGLRRLSQLRAGLHLGRAVLRA